MQDHADPNTAHGQPTQPTKASGMAVTALILSILGVCFFPFALVALVLGIIALTQISDPARALTGRGMALTATILGALGITLIPVVLMIGILLPALGAARRAARQMQNTTQVRGITQGMVTYAAGNRERLPGTTPKGYILYDDGDWSSSLTGASGHGATVEARYWLMLDNNNFSGQYIISPSETKTIWTTGPVTSANYSFALLNIHSDGDALANEYIRPDQSNRAREWKQSINTQAVLIADRARIPGGHIGIDYDRLYSIHTHETDEQWIGSIGRGDGSAYFENSALQDTKYGSAPNIEADRLFSLEQDSRPNIDFIADPNATWQDDANALLGYTSVGYEDPNIASD